MKKIFIKPGILIPVGAAVIAAFLFLWTRETIRPDFPSVYPESALEKISDAEVERKVNALLAAMTEEEVYAMLGGSNSAASAKGYGTGYVGGVPRLGVPVLRMWDGPKGVVGNGGLTTTSPASGPALAASFDEKLAYEYGRMLGEENRSTAGNVQLGVQLDIIRAPFLSKSRDSLGEDPYLAAKMGYAISAGVQDEHVISTIKHLACYGSMFSYSDNVEIDEQSLHEIYLQPFEYVVKNKGAYGVMTAYTDINGQPSSENSYLLKTVLRDMWGFTGMTMTDWGGNGTLTVHMGLDLEMERLEYNTRENIEAAMEAKTMHWEDALNAVRHTLTAMGQAGYLGLVQIGWNGRAAADAEPPASIELTAIEGKEREKMLEKNNEISLKTALEGAVLLKNKDRALPLTPEDDILLVGLLAEHTMNHYYESSYGWLEKMNGVKSPLQQILGPYARITSETGWDVIGEPVPAECLYTTPECTENGVNVIIDSETKMRFDGIRLVTNTRTYRNASDGTALKNGQKASLTAYLKAPKTGIYELQLLKIGGKAEAEFYISAFAESVPIEGSGISGQWPSNGAIPTEEGMGIPSAVTEVKLEQDQVYQITVEAQAMSEAKDLQLSLNWFVPGYRKKLRDRAVKAAAEHKKVVFFAYDNARGRGEDRLLRKNRSSLELEEGQLSLLKDVIRSAKEHGNEVIVILNTGLPVTMDWLDSVDAVLEMWLCGQAGGDAAAQILSGVKNPSGKLPVTFPANINDTQFGDFEKNYEADRVNVIDYEKGGSGIFSGYRWYDKAGIEPLFAFGHGLSYTEFAYSGLAVEKEEDGYAVTFTVENVGDVTGTEIAQIYIGAADAPDYVQMAEYALVDFVRMEDLEPGEVRTVRAFVSERAQSYWDVKTDAQEGEEKWVVAEDRMVYVGASSRKLYLRGRLE